MDVGANTAGGSFEEYLCEQATFLNQPVLGTFELNPTCNMSCRMCYIRMSEKEVNRLGGLKEEDFWLKLAEEAMEEGLLFLLLTGGEPLLYPSFTSLFEKLQRMGLYMTMNTNGTLIDDEMAAFLREHMIRRLNITIYGKDDETYARLCHNPKGFSQLEKAIEHLNLNGVPLRLNCSITAQNFDQLEDFYRIAKEWHVPLEISYYMFPPHRVKNKRNFNEIRLEPEMAAEVAYKIHTHGLDASSCRKYVERQLKYINEFENRNPIKGGFGCRAGKSNFWINWQGIMVPCGIMSGPAYVVSESGFGNSFRQMTEDVARMHVSEKCIHCTKNQICPHCAAGEIAECGSLGTAPDYHCRFADAYEAILLREHERVCV